MLKKFIKDNRGQVLYAVLVTVMFVGMISMLTMGLTLRNYNVALQKQQRVADYYAADAVAEQIRIGAIQLQEDASGQGAGRDSGLDGQRIHISQLRKDQDYEDY